MSRREIELFNLSFLDILSGALGAVLFLFIVVPKGGKSAELNQPLAISLDTIQGKFFGNLPDSLWSAKPGDSILSLVVTYDRMPEYKDCPPPVICPKCPKCPNVANPDPRKKEKISAPTALASAPASSTVPPSREVAPPAKEEKRQASIYTGDLPSVPCKFSVEIKWEDISENVDLFLCKDGSCVYGAKRKNQGIGFWDSGKSKTSLFGSDLRTTQEAVRQFDQIIPGKYDIYGQFKFSEKNQSNIRVEGLVYTRQDRNKEQGETFVTNLPLNARERTKLGTVTVREDGSFQFSKTF